MKTAIWGTAIWLTGATIADAQAFPALFDVAETFEGNALTSFDQPQGSAAGQIPADATGLEVILTDENGDWGLISLDSSAVWVEMQYLIRQRNEAGYLLTQEFACHGSQPSWTLDVQQGAQITFSEAEANPERRPFGLLRPALNSSNRLAIFAGEDIRAVIRRQICRHEESSKSYGLDIDLFIGAASPALFSGCCTLSTSPSSVSD